MPRAPISVCLITRDEPFLEQALLSVRDHVEEIVVVNTGPVDLSSAELALIDRYERYGGCNDPSTGSIEDFSRARNHSFSLASKRWAMWMDADDLIAGAGNLVQVVQEAEKQYAAAPACFMFPYEYAYGPNGIVTCLHSRERLVHMPEHFHWVNPVHENLVAKKPAPIIQLDSVVWKHQRQYGKRITEPGRNLRILRKWVESHGTSDARMLYYLGVEYHDNRGVDPTYMDSAAEYLTKYVAISGWDDEKAMACLRMVLIHEERQQFDAAIDWAFRAMRICEQWGEPYFAVARMFYHQAQAGGPQTLRNWQRCVYFARAGLALPPTQTMLFVNRYERDVLMWMYLNVALNALGDVQGAKDAAEAGLRSEADNGNLRHNKSRYVDFLERRKANDAVAELVSNGSLDPEVATYISHVVMGNVEEMQKLGWQQILTPHRRPPNYPKGVTAEDFPVAHRTAHEQAWGLPTIWKYDDLPVRMTDEQLQAVVLLVWKEYMLHDEIVAAIKFLEDAPYRVKHSPATQRALQMTKRTIAWMQDAKETQRVNTPAEPGVECGAALPAALHGQVGERFDKVGALLRRGVQTWPVIKYAEEVLDLGCFDGAMTNRWGLQGLKVTGVDMCEGSVTLANRKAQEFSTGAEHVCCRFDEMQDRIEKRFNTVTCLDTYEHVLDPVRELLDPARRMLHYSGRMIMTTPHGSWMRGSFLPWAHPWRWADEVNKAWICDESRAHVVAPTVWTVAENFRSAEYWVKDCYVELCKTQDTPGQGNVFVEALANKVFATDVDNKRIDFVIVCGRAWEAWTPETAKRTGVGGSETAVIEVSKCLVAMGHRVRVYTDCGPDGEGIYDGVEYRETKQLEVAQRCDVLVAWRSAAYLRSIESKVRLLWVHDVFATDANHLTLLQADKILALSEWHAGFLQRHHNVSSSQIFKTRNGVDLARFEQVVERDPHKVVYSSSPDRGLQALLQMWPRIRERVPDATLHVFYGFDNWRKMAQLGNNQDQISIIDSLLQQLLALEGQGVVYRGRVDQMELAREYLSAGAWLYPTWFYETSCIGAMEARLAGLRIVTSPIAALPETVGGDGYYVSGDWLSAEYQDEFVEASVAALLGSSKFERHSALANSDREEIHQRAENLSWAGVANRWIDLVADLAEQVERDPLALYVPARGFRRSA